ncbi:hypothetical protein [Pseudonocardia sp. HH130630-07]|uniref:hypothetical protein n=1 Tax=Pseudonocardia sp. HH130630-07 TaxID=1690815 RepID=UPI000815197C|nr:hypothetical protein [Pseudonocardia sp. HH130630-07]ANY07679.1 hypothetical protein AFB00_16800 [Pseudonocardia sp. HH130630-07]
MAPQGASRSTVWLETLVPAGIVRADRLVRVYLRRGCNLGLLEPACDEVSDVSFCAETESSDGPLLLGCTDDLDSADDQLGELIDALARASDRDGHGPTYVTRSDGGTDDPRWTVSSRFPGRT